MNIIYLKKYCEEKNKIQAKLILNRWEYNFKINNKVMEDLLKELAEKAYYKRNKK